MPENEHSGQTNVSVGNISAVGGDVNISSGKIIAGDATTDAPPPKMGIARLFERIYAVIDIRPETPVTDKEDLKAEVKRIEVMVAEATTKNKKIDERFLSRRLHAISRIAPDIFDLIVVQVITPFAGLSNKMGKIARRHKSTGRHR